MQQTLKEKIQAKLANSEGFTLLEILVVLTIMGFLIAMVAPRLAGISSSAVDIVCDSNQNRQIQMIAAYLERVNKFPNKMTNLVVENGTSYAIPTIVDGNPDNGKEVLAEEFVQRVQPVIHILSEDEAEELADMGIKTVFNLNAYDGSTIIEADQGTPMAQVNVEAGVGVMMSGIGYSTSAANSAFLTGTPTGATGTATTDLVNYGEAEFLGRIVLGFGPENGIITSGLVTNAAHCPGGLQDDENVVYNDYNLIVPRLAATVDRDNTPADRATSVEDIQYVAYGYTEDFTGANVGSTINTTGEHSSISAGLKARTFNYTAQAMHAYATMCPEGHMYPGDDVDFWAVDLDSTHTVTVD